MIRYIVLLIISLLIGFTLIDGVAIVWFIIVKISFFNHFESFQAISITGHLIERISFLISFAITYLIAKKNNYINFHSNAFSLQNIYLSTEVFFVISISIIVAFIVTNNLGYLNINKESSLFVDYTSVFYQFLVTGIVDNLMVTLGEEMVYRGVIFTYLLKKTRELHPSVIISSLVFSVMHINYSHPILFLLAFTGGSIFAYAYYFTRTLLVPISMHFSYNFFIEIFKGQEQEYFIKLIETDITYLEGIGDLFAVIRFPFLLLVGFYVLKRFSVPSNPKLTSLSS